MYIGYVRVSTEDQKFDLQIDALKKIGCTKHFQDIASGAKSERAGLAAAIEFARPGDVLVVWKLDRLGRSMQHLIDTVRVLESRGVGLRSLNENIDTTSAGGKLVFHIFGALAQFERELIVERTRAGLSAARARGRNGGRPPAMDAKMIKHAKALLKDPDARISDICKILGVSRATFYKYLKLNGISTTGATK